MISTAAHSSLVFPTVGTLPQETNTTTTTINQSRSSGSSALSEARDSFKLS